VVVGGVAIGIAKTNGINNENAAGGMAPKAAGSQANSARGAATTSTNQNDGTGGGVGGADVPSVAGGPSGGSNYAESKPPACPSTPVRYALPGGGGTDQFGASSALVDKPVSTLTFCLYSASDAYLGSRVLDGAAAQQFIDRVNASTDKVASTFCAEERNQTILPVATDGSDLTALAVTGTCHQVEITNGTAVRYVPDAVVDQVIGASAPVTPTPGLNDGSPPR